MDQSSWGAPPPAQSRNPWGAPPAGTAPVMTSGWANNNTGDQKGGMATGWDSGEPTVVVQAGWSKTSGPVSRSPNKPTLEKTVGAGWVMRKPDPTPGWGTAPAGEPVSGHSWDNPANISDRFASTGRRAGAEAANKRLSSSSGWGASPAAEQFSSVSVRTAASTTRRPSLTEVRWGTPSTPVQSSGSVGWGTPAAAPTRGGDAPSGPQLRHVVSNDGWANPPPRASEDTSWLKTPIKTSVNTGGWSSTEPVSSISSRNWASSRPLPEPASSQGRPLDRPLSMASQDAGWTQPVRPASSIQDGWNTPQLEPLQRPTSFASDMRSFPKPKEASPPRDNEGWDASPNWAGKTSNSGWSSHRNALTNNETQSAASLTYGMGGWNNPKPASDWGTQSGNGWNSGNGSASHSREKSLEKSVYVSRPREASPEVVPLSALKLDDSYDDEDAVPSSVVDLSELISEKNARSAVRNLEQATARRQSDKRQQEERHPRDLRKAKSAQVLSDNRHDDRGGRGGRGRDGRGGRDGRDDRKDRDRSSRRVRGERSHGNLRAEADPPSRGARDTSGRRESDGHRGLAKPSSRLFGRQMDEVNRSFEIMDAKSPDRRQPPEEKPVTNRRSNRDLREKLTGKPSNRDLRETLSGHGTASGIHVVNLPTWVRVQEVLEVFSDFGGILNVGIKPADGNQRSYAFVNYEKPGVAERAVRVLKDEFFFEMTRPLNMKLQYDDAQSARMDQESGKPAKTERNRHADKESVKLEPVKQEPARPAGQNQDIDYQTLHFPLLPMSVTTEDLERVFADKGEITRVHIVPRPKERKSFAFISFSTERAAESAMRMAQNDNPFGLNDPSRVEYAHKLRNPAPDAAPGKKPFEAKAKNADAAGKRADAVSPEASQSTVSPAEAMTEDSRLQKRQSGEPVAKIADSAESRRRDSDRDSRHAVNVRIRLPDENEEALFQGMETFGAIKGRLVLGKTKSNMHLHALVVFHDTDAAHNAVKAKTFDAAYPRQRLIEITNLSPNVGETDIRGFFTGCGKLQHVYLYPAKDDQPPRAELEFSRGDGAAKALIMCQSEESKALGDNITAMYWRGFDALKEDARELPTPENPARSRELREDDGSVAVSSEDGHEGADDSKQDREEADQKVVAPVVPVATKAKITNQEINGGNRYAILSPGDTSNGGSSAEDSSENDGQGRALSDETSSSVEDEENEEKEEGEIDEEEGAEEEKGEAADSEQTDREATVWSSEDRESDSVDCDSETVNITACGETAPREEVSSAIVPPEPKDVVAPAQPAAGNTP
ncbi:hypothetical protein DFJ77DRAFT_548444 [Powellomyces hirtus]|nr:hypothetical protein DFJ77DRAFT_548444 [Powellomyces hirtus]